MEVKRGTPMSNQNPDDQAPGDNAQRAMQHSASHTPTSLLPSGGEANAPGDVGSMEVPDGEISYHDMPMSPNTLERHFHDFGSHPLDTHDDARTYDARTVLARAVLALCNDEPAARAVTGQPVPEEQQTFQAPVLDEHHDYMPAPLAPPVFEYYDPGDPEPVEVPDVPLAVRPHAGEWWYFPAAVLVAAAVDWQGRPFLIWKRPTADLLATTPVRRGVAYYRVPHDREPPLGENLPPSAYPSELTSTSDAPQAPAPPGAQGQMVQSPPSFTTFEEMAAGWGQGAHAEDVAGNGVTRTVHFDVKVEETEVGIDSSRLL